MHPLTTRPVHLLQVDRVRIVAAIGLYFTVLGAARLAELLTATGEAVAQAEYPAWLPVYLEALCVLLTIAGAATCWAAWNMRAVTARAAQSATLAASAIALVAMLHGWFLVGYERAFAEGGLFPGALHVLSLTRIETRGSGVSIIPYRVGQGLGVVVWIAMAAVVYSAGRRIRALEGSAFARKRGNGV
jgi:hypothetical protein